MDLRDYIRTLRRRWTLIVACLLVAVAAAAFLTLRATPLYASTAKLYVSAANGETSADYQGGLLAQQRVTSYVDLVTGEEVAQRVITELGIIEAPSNLSAHTSAAVVPETTNFTVTVTDPNAARAKLLVEGTANVFTDFAAELDTPPGQKQPTVKVSVVEKAHVEAAPVSPKPVRNLGIALVLGLLAGIGLAILRETLDTTIKGVDDVSAITGTGVLGSVRFDSDAVKRPLVTDLDSHAARVEAFRVLRTNLQYVDVDRPSKVVVMTSSLPEEGKTTTAVNLAITLAQAGQRICLLEADLRRPKVSQYLRLEPSVGLTTALIGKLPITEAVQSWGSGLAVITSGATPPNPSELLQSDAMRDVLDELRRLFDVIIVDAPPLLPVTDAAILSAQADGAILVVKHGKTSREQLRGAVERLKSVDARIVGAVLSMTKGREGDGYGYGYGYGYAPEAGARSGEPEPLRADQAMASQHSHRDSR